MHYVGLSQVRISSRLHILDLNENRIKVSEKVQKEMFRLRKEESFLPYMGLIHQTQQQSCFTM